MNLLDGSLSPTAGIVDQANGRLRVGRLEVCSRPEAELKSSRTLDLNSFSTRGRLSLQLEPHSRLDVMCPGSLPNPSLDPSPSLGCILATHGPSF
eukprot:6183236-Pleurochrysis_carterae.AAC.2